MKWTVGGKLLTFTIVMLTLLAMLAGLSLISIKDVNTDYTDLVQEQGWVDDVLANLDHAATSTRLQFYCVLLTNDAYETELYAKVKKDYNQWMSTLGEAIDDPEIKRLYTQLDEIGKNYVQKADALVQMRQQGTLIADSDDGLAQIGNEWTAVYEKIKERQYEQVRTYIEKVHVSTKQVERLILIISILALVIGFGIATVLGRHLTKPIRQLQGAAEQMAAGDLTGERIQLKRNDEIGSLANSFMQMRENLHRLIQAGSKSSEQLITASVEVESSTEQAHQVTNHIAETMQNVATVSYQIAQAGEESARGMGEAATGVQRIAESAANISEFTGKVSQESVEGREELDRAVAQMQTISAAVRATSDVVNRLGDRSHKIGDIVAVIQEITAQTNLLALNAAIEAARAGENGRGFAVVADEVRKLAEESKQSAEKIAHLIQETQEDTDGAIQSMRLGVEQVDKGEVIIHKADESFATIYKSIRSMVGQIEEISAAAEEVSAATQQVTASVQEMASSANSASGQIEQVAAATEEQLASVEELTTAAKRLNTMASHLQGEVAHFKI